MEAESNPQHRSPEDTPSSLPSAHLTHLPEYADDAECKQQMPVPTSSVSENQSLEMQPINSNQSETSGDPSVSSPGVSEKETSPAKKASIPKAKLVIPASLLYSGVDGSIYDLDALPVPQATKTPTVEESVPVDVQKHFGTPKSSEQGDLIDAAISANASKTPHPNTFGASSNPSDSPALEAQDGTPGQSGWTQDGVFVPMYSRKEKSLGLLCDNFLRLFSNEQETWGGVCLDSAAKKLHVERRRIYDIVNVLESVEIVARRAKNKYAWFGMTRLPQAIERLRNATSAELNQEPADRQAAEAALGAKNAAQMSGNTFSPQRTVVSSPSLKAIETSESCLDAAASQQAASAVNTILTGSIEDAPKKDLFFENVNATITTANENQSEAGSTEDEGRQDKPQTYPTGKPLTDDSYAQFLEMYRLAKASRREKSLGVLSQKFVQLFLNSEHGVVSLEPAARKLLEEDTFNDEGQLKTKIRRLYDIANILCSLNLIEKTSSSELHRKPAFKWIYDPTKTDHRFRNVGPETLQKPLTPIKTTPKPDKKPKEPKPAKQPREPKPPKEKKEKKRKARKLDTDSQVGASGSDLHAALDPSSLALSSDIFQQLPYLQSLLQFSAINPVSAQAIIQGNPAIMAMLANPLLMNLLAMSNSYVNSFMSASAAPNFGYPDAMSNFGLPGPMPAPMGVAASPFYVPPVDPSILTQFMLSPDFSLFNSNPAAVSENPPSGSEPAGPVLKTEQNLQDSQMS